MPVQENGRVGAAGKEGEGVKGVGGEAGDGVVLRVFGRDVDLGGGGFAFDGL